MSTAEDDEYSYEEVEEVYEVDEDGNEWLVTEEYEEVDDTHTDKPTVVIANLQELESKSQCFSPASPSTVSRFQSYCKEPVRGDMSTVFGDTSTVQVSNTSPNNAAPRASNRFTPCSSEKVEESFKIPNSSRSAFQVLAGSRLKNLVSRPEQGTEERRALGPVQGETPSPSKRKIRRIRKPREHVEGNNGTDSVDEVAGEDPSQPVAVYSLSIVRDETTGREISRTVTGKKPPHYQPQGPNEKRYMTKTYRKTRTNPVNRHKEVEETTITYEKPMSSIYEQTLPAAALKPTTELNPARRTTNWEQPVWVKNKMEVRIGSANLEKPITAATTNRKNAGSLSFTIERA
jgi:hypothetical protein